MDLQWTTRLPNDTCSDDPVVTCGAGVRACVRRLAVNCKATRPACWVAPTAYLRDAAFELASKLPSRNRIGVPGALLLLLCKGMVVI